MRSGKPYVVFTPYYKRWLAEPSGATLARFRARSRCRVGIGSETIPDRAPPGDWVGGETAARARLKAWTPRGLPRYDDLHDDPGADATSRLSPYLHFGCVSPLEVAHRLRDRDGGAPYVRQICWREFLHATVVLAAGDRARRCAPEAIRQWVDDPESLAAWKEGRTGFPLVDAGMRQLREEGLDAQPRAHGRRRRS